MYACIYTRTYLYVNYNLSTKHKKVNKNIDYTWKQNVQFIKIGKYHIKKHCSSIPERFEVNIDSKQSAHNQTS